ncbi:MAG TPA: ABC transporter permease [Chloroflexota bacterium]|jgi:lipopolysaccharide transport system permease protein|nr:ABC transporter permease [Chloroflexota bacterium]
MATEAPPLAVDAAASSAAAWQWNTPPRAWVPLELGALWRYRELLYFLAWRDIKVRYQQTVLGIAWAVIQPVFMAVIFSLFLGRLAGLPSDGLPYPLFVYSGLVVWQLFALALSETTSSVVANASLVTKVYFPRLVIPLAAVSVGVVDALIASGVLVALLVYYRLPLSPPLVVAPLFLLLAALSALAVGIWLAALNVQYRDVRYTTPFLTQLWLFATPVVYPSSLVPEAWRPLLGLNPMAGVVEGFRWAVVGRGALSFELLATSVATTAVLLLGGLFYFRRLEQSFADTV